MKKLLQNLIIVLSSLVLSLVICEVIARRVIPPQMTVQAKSESRAPSQAAEKSVTGEDGSINSVIDWSGHYGIRLNPNVTATIRNHTLSEEDVVIRVNSLGLRAPNVGPKEPDEFRILAIGDSITFGDYMDESLTIPALLEKELKQAGKKVTVLNAGLPGATASDEFYHYMELQEQIKPDLVLIGAYLNDAAQTRKFYVKTLRFPFNKSRFLTWAFQRLQLIDMDSLFSAKEMTDVSSDWREEFRAGRNLSSGDSLGRRDGFDFEIYNAHNDFGLGWSSEAWDRLDKIYSSWFEIAKRNGTKVALHAFPVWFQIYAADNVLSTYPQESFQRICAASDVPYLDLLPYLRQVAASGMQKSDLLWDHCHYKVAGNELVAKHIAEWLVRDGLVK
jgi:lysophospholipase L1-like esterase